MAKKDSSYFRHDYNSRNDPKLVRVKMRHGVQGIGIFWCIVEQLYEQGGRLPIHSCESIAYDLMVEQNVVESIVSDFGLFLTDGYEFWSDSIDKRMEKQYAIRQKRADAVRNRWNRTNGNDNALQEQYKCNTNELQMNYNCNTNELQMNYNCNTNVEQVQYNCNTSADVVQCDYGSNAEKNQGYCGTNDKENEASEQEQYN